MMTAVVSRRALVLLPVLAAGSLPGLAFAQAQVEPQASPSADLIAAGIDRFYGRMRTFKASFKQAYWGRAEAAVGSVIFEKPGRMSWRYANSGNRVVSDGNLVRTYDREAKRMYEQPLAESQYPAVLAFLAGTGTMRQALSLTSLGSLEGWHLLAGQPRAATPAYERVVLYVDRRTYQVRRVLVRDSQGNRNRFDFTAMEANGSAPPGEFAITPPKGTLVVRL